jgi:hypothetical protein
MVATFNLIVPLKTIAFADNCWEWVMHRLDTLVPSMYIVPTDKAPMPGDIAVMYYEKSGLIHYAVVEAVLEGKVLISECNMWLLYESGCGYRFLPVNYVNMRGYYTPW